MYFFRFQGVATRKKKSLELISLVPIRNTPTIYLLGGEINYLSFTQLLSLYTHCCTIWSPLFHADLHLLMAITEFPFHSLSKLISLITSLVRLPILGSMCCPFLLHFGQKFNRKSIFAESSTKYSLPLGLRMMMISYIFPRVGAFTLSNICLLVEREGERERVYR